MLPEPVVSGLVVQQRLGDVGKAAEPDLPGGNEGNETSSSLY